MAELNLFLQADVRSRRQPAGERAGSGWQNKAPSRPAAQGWAVDPDLKS
jgi:hypothetical protein